MAIIHPFAFMNGVVGPTPTPTPSVPSWFSDFTFLYDANEGSTFTDLSGNSNDGTETLLGNGTITYTSGAEPYWDFDAPTPASDQPYVDTGVALGAYASTAGFTGFIVYQYTTSVTNDLTILLRADDGLPELQIYKERNSTTTTSRLGAGGTRYDRSLASNGYNAWNISFFYKEQATNTWGAAINGTSFSTMTATTTDTNDQILTVGRETISSTIPNIMKIGAIGVGLDYVGSAGDFTTIFNYYDAIYSF